MEWFPFLITKLTSFYSRKLVLHTPSLDMLLRLTESEHIVVTINALNMQSELYLFSSLV